jgi:hypothetical protein
MNMSLENYDGLADQWEHMKNIRCNLELIIQDDDSMCKIFTSTFRGFACAWYNNLKPNSIEGFSDLSAKLVARFGINIPTKKSSTKLFGITQVENESTRTYLKRFNEEMLKVKRLKYVSLQA